LVISLHGSDILLIPEHTFVHRWATRFTLGRADLVTSVAQHMTEVLPRYMAPSKPVLTLQYGIDTNCFHPPETGSPRPPICLSTRKMVPVCNLETVLLAARWLEEQDSPVLIHIANDGALATALQQKAAQLHLDNRVKFLGRIDHHQMAEALRTASLYVSMSFSDGTSLSLMEAMACGVFPVVSDIPANREWITDGVNGYLVPADSPEALVQRLNEAWHRPDLRLAAAEHNWSLVREKGDYWKNMATIEAAFVDLVGQARNRH
jgi:glycosyltransferase involved in cell wall biosynthesis